MSAASAGPYLVLAGLAAFLFACGIVFTFRETSVKVLMWALDWYEKIAAKKKDR